MIDVGNNDGHWALTITMPVLSFVALYLLSGCAVTFMIDVLVRRVDPEMGFEVGEGALCMMLWPLALGVGIVAFVRGVVGK